MTTPYDKIKEAYDELIGKYKELIADGSISFADGLNLTLLGLGSVIHIVSDFAELDSDKKKAVIVDLTTQFYIDVVEPLDLPVPDFIEGYVDKSIEQAIPLIVAALYDSLEAIIQGKFIKL